MELHRPAKMLRSEKFYELYKEVENCKNLERLEQLVIEMENFKTKKDERKILPYQDMKIGESSGIGTTTIINEDGKIKLPKKEGPTDKKGEEILKGIFPKII